MGSLNYKPFFINLPANNGQMRVLLAAELVKVGSIGGDIMIFLFTICSFHQGKRVRCAIDVLYMSYRCPIYVLF